MEGLGLAFESKAVVLLAAVFFGCFDTVLLRFEVTFDEPFSMVVLVVVRIRLVFREELAGDLACACKVRSLELPAGGVPSESCLKTRARVPVVRFAEF